MEGHPGGRWELFEAWTGRSLMLFRRDRNSRQGMEPLQPETDRPPQRGESSNDSFHRLGHPSPSKGWPGVARQLDPTRESGYRWNDARDWAVPRTAAAQREVKEHWAAEVCPVTRSIPPRAERWPSSRTGARCRRRRASSALRDGRVIELTEGSRLGGRRGAERPVPPR